MPRILPRAGLQACDCKIGESHRKRALWPSAWPQRGRGAENDKTLCVLCLVAPLRLNLAFPVLLSLFTLSAQAAVRSGGPYEVQNEAVGLAGGSAAGGVYRHEMTVGGVAGVSSVSGVVTAQGYLAQRVPLTGPEVVLGLPSGLSTVDMTLNGYVNPRGLTTTAVFEYGPTRDYGSSVDVTLSPDNGQAMQSVNVVVPGLPTNTIYHYRMSATNAEGTNRTDDGTFIVTITAQAPAVAVEAATEIGIGSANLNGLVNPNGYPATNVFEISSDGSTWTTIPAAPSPVSGSAEVGVSAIASGLQPNTTYHYQLNSTNGAGTNTSEVNTFTTDPDPPGVIAANPAAIGATSATLEGSVVTKNRATTVWFEYGTSTAYGSSTAVQQIPPASVPVKVTAPVSGLSSGVVHHYRLVASNIGGTSPGSSVSFVPVSGITPTAAPSVSNGSAFAMSLNLVLVIGTVNPNGGPTTLQCEYGTTSALGERTLPTPVGNTSNTQLALVSIENPLPGTLYYYRLVAENSLGTSISSISTFTTAFPPPDVVTGSSLSLDSTSVQVDGKVTANNDVTTVFFDYGTDVRNFPSDSITAFPSVVSGDGLEDVRATLENLRQDTTYYYRIRAENSGGTTMGLISSFKVALLSGLQQIFPSTPPSSSQTLTVHLTPEDQLTGWRFAGENDWRASGSEATGLTQWDRQIEFRPLAGYIQPPGELIDDSVTVITRDYYQTLTSGSGSMTVTLKPVGVTTGPGRAQWRLLGEAEDKWRDSGATLSGLVPGSYLIECKPVSGRATPPNAVVIIADGQMALPQITYYLPHSAEGAIPAPSDFAHVSGDTTKPYAYLGQLRSDAGHSSGFVVKPRVVATAAHVVWDDGTLAAAQNLQWLHQRHAGVHEPRPVTPRGYFIFTSYDAQRILEATPGTSTPQSQNLDVAALFFNESAGRDGLSGFLASDLPQNEHLLSGSAKMLVGYMIDGVAPAYQGIVHATPAGNAVFTQSHGRTYATNSLRGSGGGSGGPLCVLHTNGNWYPAAIFLGGNNQTIVRAIDSDVIDLFNRAQTSGNGGDNNTNGGITYTSYTSIGGNAGALKVYIKPIEAVNLGARWRLAPEPATSSSASGATRLGLSPASYILQFLPVNDYEAPEPQNIAVAAGELTELTFTYASPEETWRRTYFGTTASSGNGADDFDYDGDGFTNAEEYTAGTNPTLAADYFKADNPQRGGGSFTLSAAGKAGRSYALQRSITLAPGKWITVDSEGPLGSDGPVALTDAIAPSDAAFYRIRVTGP